ncbi:MAG: dTDP-4-dehydrorhamnose 3,5-epimerase family protein [Candidatus Rokubacteria bacterium]|nr:dTDP-4-dehydrorhamnose 3,5-epimerase family protein [Candidatus Rokubacteria bacterium]
MDFTPEATRHFSVQSYAPAVVIDGVAVVDLKRHHDDGGSLTELARFTDGHPEAFRDFTLRQVNYSEVEPGAVKAFHLHTRQTDIWYVPPSDRILVVLVDARRGSRTEGVRMRFMLGNGSSRLVRIPPGVAHGVRNLAPATGRIIYFVDGPFSPEPAACDEGRLPWDFAGADVWDPVRG